MENNPQDENRCYLEGAQVRVVVVRVGWARVADYRGRVTDWKASGESTNDGGMGPESHSHAMGMVNGGG